jgi:hypothetical protein
LKHGETEEAEESPKHKESKAEDTKESKEIFARRRRLPGTAT